MTQKCLNDFKIYQLCDDSFGIAIFLIKMQFTTMLSIKYAISSAKPVWLFLITVNFQKPH